MPSKYSVSLERLIKEFDFETLYLPVSANELSVTSPDVNRPGLILAGRDDYFDPERAQFLGLSEIEFLKTLDTQKQYQSLKKLCSKRPPFILITRNLTPPDCIFELAEQFKVPLLRTSESTSSCMSALINFLGTELADRITRHGVLVEVYGEGILIIGDSGVGKSETAVELIKRGHRLIADDAVEIRRVSSKTLVGSAPDNIRHFIELRGIGIINARRIFGMGAVKLSEKINMVIQLEPWNPEKVYDRMGIDNEYINIMNVKIPLTVVPVKPGRNLAIIIEVAAMNNRQKKMGYNAAKELLHQLGIHEEEPEPEEVEIWQSY
ncbi:MAG: HPr(Ser) kinase/phosphatase [Clostridia bacterium]|nr:HPr(Ser) kinase/phosphatase [Clostridia bacterium]